MGYCTIYGDMNGGYNPVKDMYKTRMFLTARWRNENHRPWMKGPAGMVIPSGSSPNRLRRIARQSDRSGQPAPL